MSTGAPAAGPQGSGEELDHLLEDDPADLYENAPCGYLSMLPGGTIVKVNRTFCTWTGRPAEEVLGARFQDLLDIGGQVFHETHLAPLLRMQGSVREIALEIVRVDGSVLPCLLNAVEVRDERGSPVLVRATVFEVTARRRYEQELLAAQRAAEESESRARTLHQVVSDLAAATTVEDVAAVILQRSRAALRASGSALVLADVADAGGSDHVPPAVVRAEGVSEVLLEALRVEVGEQPAREPAHVVRTLRSDERTAARHPRLAAAMDGAALTELVLVPVLADSRWLGALVVVIGADEGGLISLDEAGARPALPAADVDLLWTLGRQAGQALERARLHEETARQAERAAFLLDAARLMAMAADVEETAERIAELAVPRLADVCLIDLLTDRGVRRMAARHGDPGRQRLADRLRQVPLQPRGRAHPGVASVADRRTVWLREVDEGRLAAMAVDDRHLAVLDELGLADVISVPFLADGRVLGAVTLFADRRRGPFTSADVEVAEQLAFQVALVIDKAQRYEAEVRTSHALQQNLLPPRPPAVPGLAIAARYLPATQGVEVGGDFYDVVVLPDGSVAIAVGDVVGHDLTAAATMGQLTSVHRALLADLPSPSAVVGRLQASWSLLGLHRMATVLFADLDPATGRLRMASAGHLAPILLSGDRVELLPVRPARLLGAPPGPHPPAEWAGLLPPGGTLLLFTDGLVESRTEDLDAGLARLVAAAGGARSADPEALCDRLLAELTGSHRADDIALLALTRSG